MPTAQIANPFGADNSPAFSGASYIEALAGGTITALQVVTMNSVGSVIAASSASKLTVGIAVNSAVSGGLVRVVTSGYVTGVTVDSGAGVTAGDLVVAAASGNLVTSATPAAGTGVGVVLATTAASGLAPIFVKLI
jgi:hypothetical protein